MNDGSITRIKWTQGKKAGKSKHSKHLLHRFCWRWGIRFTALLLVWLSVTIYIWISTRSACDSRIAEILLTKDTDTRTQAEHGNVPEVVIVTAPQTRLPSLVQHVSSEEKDLTDELERQAEGNTLGDIYRKQLVGFSALSGANCQKALQGKAKNSMYPQFVRRVRTSRYIVESQDCRTFLEKSGFNRYPRVSEEEREYPIAFIILFYKDLDQVLYLLRALYRPHNVYCLSVDTKASVEFLEAVRSVSHCLPNVFLASKLENIVYAGFTRLMADIDCMDDLLRHPVQWKYVINMPGTQFPLRTNLELVRILKIFNGANDIEGLTGDMLVADRFQFKHTYVTDTETGELRVKKIFVPNDPPPHGLEMVKGSTYGTFSRAFVEFAIRDPVSKDFLEWCKTVKSPDEYFWGTLHHSKTLDVPGGFRGEPHKKPWLTSFSLWETNPKVRCATMYIHKICIFSPEDFPSFIHRGQLFVNKFYITHHPAALHCLDEMLVNLTYTGQARDLSFYKKVPFAIPRKAS